MEKSRKVMAKCFICGEDVAFMVTEHPKSAWANNRQVSSYTTAYQGRRCECRLFDWAEPFAQQQAWSWMTRDLVQRFHAESK